MLEIHFESNPTSQNPLRGKTEKRRGRKKQDKRLGTLRNNHKYKTARKRKALRRNRMVRDTGREQRGPVPLKST